MNSFDYFTPTEIIFGWGRVQEIGKCASSFGKKAILVTVPEFEAITPLYRKVKKSLLEAGMEFVQFDGVIPNPTTHVEIGRASCRERV